MVHEFEVLRLHNKRPVFRRWARFAEFVQLHANLQSCFPSLAEATAALPSLPSKTWLPSSTGQSEAFYDGRATELQEYIRQLLLLLARGPLLDGGPVTPGRATLPTLPYLLIFLGLISPAEFEASPGRTMGVLPLFIDTEAEADG